CCVLPIEKIRIRDANKKLRAGAVRIVRARHGEHPSFVWFAVELGLDLVPGTSHAMRRTVRVLAVGIATLDHETGNDPMKGRAGVEALSGQLREVLHMPGRHIMKESQP